MPDKYCTFTFPNRYYVQPLYRIKPEGDRTNLFLKSALTVDISRSHLALIVVDTDLNIVDYLDYYPLEVSTPENFTALIREVLSEHPYAGEKFASVQVICHTDDTVLLPARFFKPQHRRKWLEWQTGDLTGLVEMEDRLEQEAIYLLYALPESLYNVLQNIFPAAVFCHAHSAMLRAQTQRSLPDGYYMVLSVYAGLWTCSAWKNGNLELIRSFDRTTADDLCFRLLDVCKSLNWMSDHTSLEIGGMINRNAAELTLLKRFFAQVSLTERPADLLYDDGFFNHPAHFFSPLIQHTLCGS